MIQAEYFSKKFGRPILPELVALNAQFQAKSEAAPAGAHAPIDADRKRQPVRQ